MKKFLSAAAITVILTAAIAAPVSAHSSHHRRLGVNSAAAGYSVCTDKDCVMAGLHPHDGTYRYAHYYGDGHDYHPFCDIEDCVLAGYHAHGGSYCFGHTVNDGHGHNFFGGGHH